MFFGSIPAVITPFMNKEVDYESLNKAGSMLGSGGVIVMDDSSCMVSVLETISRFYFAESCGQCSPCREGTGWMYRLLSKIISGNGTHNDIEVLESIPGMIQGSTICALGDAAAMPVESFIKNFKDEFVSYIK